MNPGNLSPFWNCARFVGMAQARDQSGLRLRIREIAIDRSRFGNLRVLDPAPAWVELALFM